METRSRQPNLHVYTVHPKLKPFPAAAIHHVRDGCAAHPTALAAFCLRSFHRSRGFVFKPSLLASDGRVALYTTTAKAARNIKATTPSTCGTAVVTPTLGSGRETLSRILVPFGRRASDSLTNDLSNLAGLSMSQAKLRYDVRHMGAYCHSCILEPPCHPLHSCVLEPLSHS